MPGRYTQTIADLLSQQGEIAARGAAASGQIWGNAVGSLGQIAGQAVQDYGVQRQEKQKAEIQAKRDQAFGAFVDSGIWATDPVAAVKESVKIFGPEGMKIGEGLIGASKLMQAKDKPLDPKNAQEALGMIARGWLAAPDSLKPGLYESARKLLIDAGMGTEETIPEQVTPEVLPMIQQMAAQPEKAPEPKVVGGALVSPTGEVIYQAEQKPEKSLVDIQAEAAARARGTASVKPPAAGPEPGVVESYVSDLKAGHKIWSDVPANLRNQVQAAASAAKVQAPTKRPSEATITSLAEGQDLVTRTADLLSSPVGVQEWAKAAVIPDWVTQMTGWGGAAKAKKSEFFLYMAESLKAIQGSRPSDKDMQWYMENLPRQGDPPEVRDRKVAKIQDDLTRRYNSRVKGLKASGYALGGFDELGGTDDEPPPE